MNKEPETNCQFLERIMNYGCPTGPLIQAFVLQAIEKYATAVVAAPAESMDSPLLSGAAWQDTARFALSQLEKHFKK